MGTNKHAIIRYQALDKCFRNKGRNFYIDDLIEACNDALYEYDGTGGVKRRQILYDINFMESEQGWSIPLERYKDGKKVYFRYYDLKFSINNQPLTATETDQLKEALLTLSRLKGMPQFEWMDEIIARLESNLGIKTLDNKVVSFEENKYLAGLEHFSFLYESIVYQKTLDILYQGFKMAESVKYTFHPYHLKQYNNRWFIFGLNNESKQIQNLALDRIVSIDESKIPYFVNSEIDFEEYFEDVVGVTIESDKPTEKIQLQIDIDYWPYIKTKPLHGSQKIISKTSKYVEIELELKINYELIATVFALGENVRIVAPEPLKRILLNKANDIITKNQ
ncbi:MAG: WYL domain-containing protein [Bacteroidales bacterium]|nr:WYL domain-containing protein [Bacteroidales bacterium]